MRKNDMTLTRRVLVEKAKNNFLFIYAAINTNNNTKWPLRTLIKQVNEGVCFANQLNLVPIHWKENYITYRPEHIIGLGQLSLLKLVIEQRAKYVYVRSINLLSRNKRLRNYILHLYSMLGVQLYTKKGYFPLENLELTSEMRNQLDILIQTVEESVQNPYEFIRSGIV